ncbi:MAG TPA: hypothetical protein VKJ65_09515 [Phycisphaerae bacterium]|nr:hypothetical protein [Phycisphaerae bacterium]
MLESKNFQVFKMHLARKMGTVQSNWPGSAGLVGEEEGGSVMLNNNADNGWRNWKFSTALI